MGDVGRKIALLIGVGDYGAGLKSLQCPVNGVTAMQTVLQNPEIGGFDEAQVLINPDVGEMRSRISTTFAQLNKNDLALLYFTGHGIKDMIGDFYLTTAQSELFDNKALNTGTAVEAEFVQRVMKNAYAERKVVILDCCFAAAFADGFIGMDDSSVDVEAQLGAQDRSDKGYCVLTASTSTRYALEQDGEDLSVYTRYLVEGLKTGGAAPEGQGFISLRHWHEYVKGQVKAAAPAMEPAMFNRQQGYDIVIAKALVDAEQSYRKQVQKKVKAGRGRLRPSSKANLVQWQIKLGISAEHAKTIQAEVLKPYQEKEKHVKHYAAVLMEEKAYAYPLGNVAVAELQELKRLLNLRDEDVLKTEVQILGGSLLHEKGTSQYQPQPSTTVRQIQSESALSTSDQSSNSTFIFETVKVNKQGKIIEKIPGEAEYFTEDLGNSVTLDMIRIPSGKFLMGAPEGESGARINEYPQREVSISEFWIGKATVTQEQWDTIANLEPVEQLIQRKPSKFGDLKNPVEQVSWIDAMEFCLRLSQLSGKEYSLPSEAQWEYACRAGTKTPFSFGPTISTGLANYDGQSYQGTYGRDQNGIYRQKTTKIGSFPPNSFGLYDMHGNVWEWCLEDQYGKYYGAPTDGELRKFSDLKKVRRGGCWSDVAKYCRSTCRSFSTASNCDCKVGFRVMTIAPSTLC